MYVSKASLVMNGQQEEQNQERSGVSTVMYPRMHACMHCCLCTVHVRSLEASELQTGGMAHAYNTGIDGEQGGHVV